MVGIDDGLVDVERNATSIHVGAARAHQNRGALIGGWKILRASNADVDHVIGFAVGRDSDVIKRSARERKLWVAGKNKTKSLGVGKGIRHMHRKGRWGVWFTKVAREWLFDIGKQEAGVGFGEIDIDTANDREVARNSRREGGTDIELDSFAMLDDVAVFNAD